MLTLYSTPSRCLLPNPVEAIFHQHPVAKSQVICQHKDVNAGRFKSPFETLPDKGICPHISNFPALTAGSELINLER